MGFRWQRAPGAFMVVVLSAVCAQAAPGEVLQWAFQDTGIQAAGGQTALAMRDGLAWPVIFNDSLQNQAISLFPAGNTTPGAGAWKTIGSGLFTRPPYRLRAASSVDGRIAVVGSDSSGGGLGGAVSTLSGGWSMLPLDTRDVAFDATGSLRTAARDAVAGFPKMLGATISDFAVSPTGDVGLIDTNMRYWHYSAWLGTWNSAILPSVGMTPVANSAAVEFDSRGRPHIVAVAGSTVFAFDFSPINGTWAATPLANTSRSDIFVALAANDDGEVGTAWVGMSPSGQGTSLTFAYKTDEEPWTTALVTSSVSISQRLVGVTYDYDGLPVLSYINESGRLALTYDPKMSVVPEPACGALAFAGVSVLLRRRRR